MPVFLLFPRSLLPFLAGTPTPYPAWGSLPLPLEGLSHEGGYANLLSSECLGTGTSRERVLLPPFHTTALTPHRPREMTFLPELKPSGPCGAPRESWGGLCLGAPPPQVCLQQHCVSSDLPSASADSCTHSDTQLGVGKWVQEC